MKPLRMHQPPHPGEILRELCLVPLELSVTEAADSLGVSRNTLSAILNGRAERSRKRLRVRRLAVA
jgi:antitoxin HigA-1